MIEDSRGARARVLALVVAGAALALAPRTASAAGDAGVDGAVSTDAGDDGAAVADGSETDAASGDDGSAADAGSGTDGSPEAGGGVPLACDGALCDTTNGADFGGSCSAGRASVGAGRIDLGWTGLLGAVALLALRRRREQTR